MMNLRDLYMYPHDIGASSLYSMPLFFATPSQWNFPCSTLSLCQNRSRPNFVGHTFAQTLDWNVGMHPSFLHYPSCLPRLVWVRVEFSDLLWNVAAEGCQSRVQFSKSAKWFKLEPPPFADPPLNLTAMHQLRDRLSKASTIRSAVTNGTVVHTQIHTHCLTHTVDALWHVLMY